MFIISLHYTILISNNPEKNLFGNIVRKGYQHFLLYYTHNIFYPFKDKFQLTHYQTTNFRLFQRTISNLTKMAESYPNE